VTTENRTDLVYVSGRGRVKDTIHRTECRFVARTDPFYVRPLPRHVGESGQMSHRLYRTCNVCLKGLSTFRLPAEPAS
jgi:hypothetical protein